MGEYPPKTTDQSDVLEKEPVSEVETPKVVSEQEKLAAEAIANQKMTETAEKITEKKSFLGKIFHKKEKLTPEAKMAKWTPKHEAALKFLTAVNPSWFEKMGEAQVDKVEQFVSNPAYAGFSSVKYDKDANKYSASGKSERASVY